MRLSPQRLLMPLLVSFSLTGAGVLIIYFLNQKNDEKKKIKKSSSKRISVEISIPRQYVPLIIGRSGSMIQNIQQSTYTNISFKQDNDIDSLERICVISGTPDNIKLAEAKIKCILENQPLIETYETLVPQRSIDKITERGGEILNKIQNQSNAKIIISKNSSSVADPDTKSRVIIKGTAKQIADALTKIEDKVLEDKITQNKAENSSLSRAPRIETPQVTSKNDISKDNRNSKGIFGNQAPGSFMEVYISAMENPSQFYIQIKGDSNEFLDDLVKEMTEYYDSQENQEIHALNIIHCGQMVAAKFYVDNKWYRAEVTTDLGEDKYEVYFVDFGDKAKVSKNNIFELRTDFLGMKLQAIECSLAGVKPRDGEWSLEACEKFCVMCAVANWKTRIAKIRRYKERTLDCSPSRREGSPIPCIELYDKQDDQLINIGQELIKLQLAVAEDEPWTSSRSNLTNSLHSHDASPEALSVNLSLDRSNNSDGSSSNSSYGFVSADTSHDVIALTPKPKKKEKEIEVIDLTTPVKPFVNFSCGSYLENAKNSSTTNNDSFNKHKNNSLPPNPFHKEQKKRVIRNVLPAGYESESDSDDGFELN